MKVGDKFYTIAHGVKDSDDLRIVKVEVTEVKDVYGKTYVDLQNLEKSYENWFVPIENASHYRFSTYEETEKALLSLLDN
jgi:hypothetical protein